MAGILDEIMEGLNAKPAVANNATVQTETKTDPAPQEQTQQTTEKGLHEYSDKFKEMYGKKQA